VVEAATVGQRDMGGPGGTGTREGKGHVGCRGGGRGPVALGRPEGIVFFFIYSKTFEIELNQFDPKMVFPYSKKIQIKYGFEGN
jgi:hypothetical protein